MRFQFVTALATLALSAVLISGCGQQKSAAPAKSPAAYTLSADSNQKFLSDNKAKAGVITLPSGLQYRVLKSGSGKSPTSGEDIVTVTYKGWLIDGTVFDQTEPGKTASFPAGHLIPGWVEALRRMKEGDSWELVIPAELGYGAEGAGNSIPPNQTLVFDMELVSVAPPPQ
jgi:FKBP-type peptidyl-prolyl cis-trans isomerase FklB